VGRPSAAARFRVEDYRDVRRLLSSLIEGGDSLDHRCLDMAASA
jgi:hypothetical protein